MNGTGRAGASILALGMIGTAAIAAAQTDFAGTLDGKLHVDPANLSVAKFDPVAAGDPALAGISADAQDHAFSGSLTLQDNVHYTALIIRSPTGADVLYLDANRDGSFGPEERFPMHHIEPPVERLQSTVEFDIKLPDGPYKSRPMIVRLPQDGVPTPAGPGHLAVLFSNTTFVEGAVRLPKRTMRMRFEYDFKQRAIDLTHGLEWADLDGDGVFDLTPGSPEFLRARGGSPIFQVADRTLQTASVSLDRNAFVLHTVEASEYSRFQLKVGSVLPDFAFTNFAGVRRHLSDVKASYVLVDFWATWCVPCMEELPGQKKVYDDLHARGFEILGMNGDREAVEKAQAALKKTGVVWEQARYEKTLFEDRFQISQWPTVVLIDDRRRIVSTGRADGLPLDSSHLAQTLNTLLVRNR